MCIHNGIAEWYNHIYLFNNEYDFHSRISVSPRQANINNIEVVNTSWGHMCRLKMVCCVLAGRRVREFREESRKVTVMVGSWRVHRAMCNL